MGRSHICWRCDLLDEVNEVFVGPHGRVPVHLQPLADVITSMPRANSGWVWIKRPRVRVLLRGLADGTTDLSHEALDHLPPGATVEYLRGLLVAHGCLPQRDHHLAEFQRWLPRKLKTLTDPADQRLIERYARWHVLHRLRRAARTGPVSSGAFLHAKQVTTVAVGFLTWLGHRGQELDTLSQRDVDAWFADGPTTRCHARGFLYWAINQRLVRSVTVPPTSSATSPAISEQERLEQLRRLLTDDTLIMSHRLIGLLVLLFGQPVSKIARLRTTNVILDEQRTALRLADDQLEVPEPVAALLRCYLTDPRYRCNTAAHLDSPWLFPGLMPGRPMHVYRVAEALRSQGISPRAAHTGTWLQLVREAPPSVLAQTLGITPTTAMRHAARAGTDYLDYPSLRT